MNKQTIRFHGEVLTPQTLAEAVLEGLARRPRRLSPKFFYDERGSRLFDAICDLPEYYPTRTEMGILESCAMEVARLTGEDCTLIELGSGATRKIRLLLESLRPRHYVGVDISHEFLQESVQRLAHDYPWLEAHAVCADFTDEFDLPAIGGSGRRVLFFPGSTIGNFEPHEALALLQRLRRMVQAGGGLLIGVDLKKDPQILHDAYNDGQGITAAFNLNLLERIRTELGHTGCRRLSTSGLLQCATGAHRDASSQPPPSGDPVARPPFRLRSRREHSHGKFVQVLDRAISCACPQRRIPTAPGLDGSGTALQRSLPGHRRDRPQSLDRFLLLK